ncbi:uncharacterized protein LOC129958670 [Argiope bruennichi]|uniref:Uncharacterized protein n=1 Tax=Argiope bruennichi TaxID=94029 RepID=A0A8T0EZW6_ARGBR|nr:uncharacterized protein LOC129958670 [Argiope bruennichi]KAF8784416.1 hypothetical protein HNY73_010095 [Argiope bruennichi]
MMSPEEALAFLQKEAFVLSRLKIALEEKLLQLQVEELQLEAGVRVLTTKKELSEMQAKRRKKSRVSRFRSKVVTSTPRNKCKQPELESLDPDFDVSTLYSGES